jgi:hypothetical protein
MTKKISLALLALSLFAAAPAFAGNDYGYVCTVTLHPAAFSQANGLGNEGDILLTINSQPDCGGTQTGYVYVFSVGATYPNVNTTYLYAGADLRAMYQALVDSRNKPTQRNLNVQTGTGVTFQALTISFQ